MRLILLFLIMAAPLRAQRVLLDARVEQRPLSLSAPAVPLAFDPAHAPLWSMLRWRAAQAGVAWSEIDLWAGSLRLPLRAIVLHVDPRKVDLQLLLSTKSNGMTGTWNVDAAASDVAFALNAGQFKETGPWGWLVLRGRETRAPGFGPLSAGIVIDTTGVVRWLLPAQFAGARRDRAVRDAFQSYPLLIYDGRVPRMLLRSSAVDRKHRDARLLFAQRADGTLLILLTRYEALGGFSERVPVGLTVPESVVLAGALGARHALMLDGGISAQMLVRTPGQDEQKWRGLRNVPLALIGLPKTR